MSKAVYFRAIKVQQCWENDLLKLNHEGSQWNPMGSVSNEGTHGCIHGSDRGSVI